MPSPKPLIPPPWRVEILATDINYTVLRYAQEGIYSENQMESVDYAIGCVISTRLAIAMRSRTRLKDLVHFDFHNLKTEFLPQRNDMIFCRNVMIYFDEAEQKRLVEKFSRCLNRRRLPFHRARGKPVWTFRQIRDGTPEQRHSLSAALRWRREHFSGRSRRQSFANYFSRARDRIVATTQ